MRQKTRGGALGRFFRWLGTDLKDIGTTFVRGDWKTRMSYLIMGFGQIARGQFLRGFAMLALQALLLAFIILFGWNYLSDITTLGTVESSTKAAAAPAPDRRRRAKSRVLLGLPPGTKSSPGLISSTMPVKALSNSSMETFTSPRAGSFM